MISPEAAHQGPSFLLLASVIPVGTILLAGSAGPLGVGLGLAQAAGIFLGVRASFRWLRNRLPVWLVGVAILPFYMGLCLLTNLILVRLGNLISTG